MATYKTPGVFVEEISKFPATIAPVATAVPAFIGYTQFNPGEPKRISSMVEFIDIFGGPAESVVVLTSSPYTVSFNPNAAYLMFYSMQLYFGNGGGSCWIVSAGAYKTTGTRVVDTELTGALTTQLVREDEPTIIYFPDAINVTSGPLYGGVINAALAQCNLLKDRFVIADIKDNGSIATDSGNFRTDVTSSFLKYGAAYYPRLNTTLAYPDSAVILSGGFLDTLTLEEAITQGAAETGPTPISNALAPILGPIRDAIAAKVIIMPPGGAMAGIYAQVDRNRGVWQAPANIGLNLVSSPTIKINDQDQEGLNVDPIAGKSINAIRFFTGKGTLVWGSRTLAGNDNEWRYVPVRRLFIFVEESIRKATDGIVFEPNDANTWVKVKGMIQNFLTGLWRQGALAGAKPEDAFFVKVGLGETMSAQDILDGNLIVEIGMAAVRPAEFIILRFSHKLQVS